MTGPARWETRWLILGAVVGGLIVGPFGLEPFWLWGMAGGVAGGFAGALAASLARRPWPLPWRAAGIVAVVGTGFLTLWMASSLAYLVRWLAQGR